ncbi:MAG: C13 family peptidase [Caulobacter sp.]|nr:C13 family peptidase [Caulobacter sp.]
MLGRLLATLGCLVLLSGAATAQTVPASPYANWAAVVVAGDWRAHDGGPTEAFDNARRDVAASLLSMGFRPERVTQFSTRPELYADTRPERLTAQSMLDTLKASAEKAPAGCLIYYTSHGAPNEGVVMDVLGKVYMFSPAEMAALADEACPARPTIVIISACFSGAFVPYLEGPQRMVVTAARPDRSSFGCSSEDKYPYFDACFLETVGSVRNFPSLAPAIQTCVSTRETRMRMSPPSEPQVSIDGVLRLRLGMMPFAAGARGVQSP